MDVLTLGKVAGDSSPFEDPDHTVWEITSPTAFDEDADDADAVVTRWLAAK